MIVTSLLPALLLLAVLAEAAGGGGGGETLAWPHKGQGQGDGVSARPAALVSEFGFPYYFEQCGRSETF